jgi:hypothetical protein
MSEVLRRVERLADDVRKLDMSNTVLWQQSEFQDYILTSLVSLPCRARLAEEFGKIQRERAARRAAMRPPHAHD